jgi:hypothetical protein
LSGRACRHPILDSSQNGCQFHNPSPARNDSIPGPTTLAGIYPVKTGQTSRTTNLQGSTLVARFAPPPPFREPRLSLLPPSLTLNKELGRRSFLRVKDSTSGPLRGGVFLSRSGEIKKKRDRLWVWVWYHGRQRPRFEPYANSTAVSGGVLILARPPAVRQSCRETFPSFLSLAESGKRTLVDRTRGEGGVGYELEFSMRFLPPPPPG